MNTTLGIRGASFLATMAALVLTGLQTANGQTSATISVQTDQPGHVIPSTLWGIFFEEINFAGEGGLYAEMVRNRSLDNSANADFWTLVTQGTAAGQMSVDTSRPLNTNNLRSLKLTMQSGTGSVGAANAGFWGIALQSGAAYDLSLYASATPGFAGPLSVRLESANGSTVYAQTNLTGLTTNWQRFDATLVSSGSNTNARIVLSITTAVTVWLDMVSLFPQATFHSRTNGLRLDLANMLTGLNPSFYRYPGGNFIESQNVTNAVRWKKTIGGVAQRPGHLNDAWGYWSTDGYGLQEFFLQCEDMGIEPLYGINCGLMLGYNGNANNTVPLNEMGPWVQDALDLIEYANGDTNTTWGAVRAANGHPAPFNLKYLEIGNENGGSYYNERYTLFYDALKAQYPDIHLIAPGNWSGGPPTSRPVEIKDEHYYSNPATFISYATKYDSYSRSGSKVFVGEYAVTQGYGTYGNLSAALGEAAFMTGIERNSDVVEMACYAPLFANVNGIQWHPDLIYYDSSRCFGTPSYYVQQMFSQNRGDVILPTTVVTTNSVTNASPHGAIGLGTWATTVQFTNVVVTSNGVTLYQSDFVNQGMNGWRVFKGAWNVNTGRYQQTSIIATDCRSTTGDTNWANYTLTLRARKTGGFEGFLILFNWLDDNNWTWWNIGGWANTLSGIEQMAGGSKSLVGGQVSRTITQNTWYDIRIVLTGPRIQCYLDGALVHDVTYGTTSSAVLATASYANAGGEIIVKAVNPSTQPVTTAFNLAGVNSVAPTATLIQLTSGSLTDENSLAAPTNVSPVTNVINNAGTNFTIVLPALSFSILRLQASGINTITNLLLEIPSPINGGQIVASTVWGQKPDVPGLINLIGNPNYALTWSSANTSVAVVDAAGNVTGVGSGTTSIIVTYGSLGLSATQSVQVISVPTALAHRYSFSESSGTTAADLIGGPVWNGTLPNSGAFGSGQLALASGSQQFVQLPAGILSNYSAVTIEAWVMFTNQLPGNCFFFGFGNTNGSLGTSYIFCAPRAGRIAITATDFNGEQNADCGVDFSFHTNFHVVAVFNPPLGYVALYTNGTLAAINNSVTVPLSSVNDVFNYIGKSLYSGDPYPSFSLDEFRIYNGALQGDEITAAKILGPNQVLNTASPVLSVAQSGGNLTLSWPLASAGFMLESRTNLAFGGWTAVQPPLPQIFGSQWQVTLPLSGNSQYYRLQK